MQVESQEAECSPGWGEGAERDSTLSLGGHPADPLAGVLLPALTALFFFKACFSILTS